MSTGGAGHPNRGRPEGTCSRLAVGLATGLGVGFVPLAPGTVGSAVWGLPLAYLADQLALPVRIVLLAGLCTAGTAICTVAARRLGAKDPPAVVLDEITSMPVAFFLVPMTRPALVLTGFALNRLIDIVKPFPLRRLERLPQGLGIMADDLAGGLYCCLLLHLMIWLTAP